MGAGVVYKWSEEEKLSILKKPSNITNGNFVDRQGRIVSCEHATSCVSRIETDGRYIRVLATHYKGKELNSPNDIVVDSKDRIWFTNPAFTVERAPQWVWRASASSISKACSASIRMGR